jgi:hypothetical protein
VSKLIPDSDAEVKARVENVVEGLPGVLPRAGRIDVNLNLQPSQRGCLMRKWRRMRTVATTSKALATACAATSGESWCIAIAVAERGCHTA